MAEVMDYSERLMRAMLADLPDGEGHFEDFCDGDGIPDDARGRDAPFWIRMHVKKTGDRVTVDFTGSDPHVKGPINAPLSVTASGVYCGLKTAVDPNSLIPAQLRLLAHHRGDGAEGLGGERAVPLARRLRQPRDLPSRRRHGDGRAGERLARAR